MTTKAYPAYKNSGIDWIGEIPAHWEVKRIKYLFLIGRGRVIAQTELDSDGEFPVYSSQTQNDGTLGYIKTYDYDCTQITWTTDGANAGTVFLRTGKHNCTNVCGTLKPVSNNFKIVFVKYALEVAAQFYKRPDTNGAKIMNGEMAVIFITFPPLPEQAAIAAFLDKKTALIDQAIKLKEQQIALLKERKQIIIHQAVTRGLNPNVPLKDSGISWIGEIPSHWEVKRLKYLAEINRYSLPEDTDKELEFKYIDIGSVTLEEGIFQTALLKFKDAPSRARRIAKNGDTIISTVRTYLKAIDYVDESKERFIYSTGFAILEPKKIVFPKFLSYFVKSDCFTNQVSINSIGISYPAINSTELSKLILFLPPISEQATIVNHIEVVSSKISSAISIKEQEIEKLKEYKQVLINSAVTGKIKVG